jgi:hypothetical protein
MVIGPGLGLAVKLGMTRKNPHRAKWPMNFCTAAHYGLRMWEVHQEGTSSPILLRAIQIGLDTNPTKFGPSLRWAWHSSRRPDPGRVLHTPILAQPGPNPYLVLVRDPTVSIPYQSSMEKCKRLLPCSWCAMVLQATCTRCEYNIYLMAPWYWALYTLEMI